MVGEKKGPKKFALNFMFSMHFKTCSFQLLATPTWIRSHLSNEELHLGKTKPLIGPDALTVSRRPGETLCLLTRE